MTETEKKALALLNEICVEMGLDKVRSLELDMPGERALLRAIEQHEAFRQEVSDAVEWVVNSTYMPAPSEHKLRRFVIAKPDPLVVVLGSAPYPASSKELAAHIRADMKARGYEWRKIEGEG